ncbi:hypothetical protein CONCODRAFT_79936 [Conidiobolus coronatus NRRL 28638]|uniref:N-acetyltransferase domain-containing protein n=1 Tax=Conidiobolus coronatus (strain ATCC 28846 / CBS 209.66 / NRRL 28638) TaxID=796925 RepID=A0A137NYZ1_CONC2|nr:hypothetical protein CONCODRAFT_79936 [Conidiobolus coronatus NRRL 28638]|eukprot:KXN68006.1 hypothetical protein CONCODRAFT_79936 [Conidiobolus coronatus NRRL 28638]
MSNKELQALEKSEGLDMYLYSSIKKHPSPFKSPTLVVEQLKNIEKKLFPKSEQMDFSKELKSSNSTLIYGIDKGSKTNQITAYLIYQYNPFDKLFRLIKVGIEAKNQRKGYATLLVNSMINLIKSKSQEFEILLHVDVSREKAIKLYEKFNFEILETIENYYGNDRSAHLMRFINKN